MLVLIFGLPTHAAPNVLPSENSHRQARKSILDPSPAAKTRPLSFNRTQSRVVIGFPTGHNTLRRHFYLMGMKNIPL